MSYKAKITAMTSVPPYERRYSFGIYLHALDDKSAIHETLNKMDNGSTATIYKGFYYRVDLSYMPFFIQTKVTTIDLIDKPQTKYFKINRGVHND